MSELRDGLQGSDRDDKGASSLVNFTTELKAIKILLIYFSDIKILHVLRVENEIYDSLVKTAKSF